MTVRMTADLEREAERARQRAARIDGWLSDAQGRALFQAAAASTGRGAIVEIGSWKGRSTTWLASGARLAGRRVYAIDPHSLSREDPEADTLDEFLANLARGGLTDVVDPLIMRSDEAAARIAGPIELLFIDGDHSDQAVRRDAELWLPRVMEGRYRDVPRCRHGRLTGPRRVVREMVCRDPHFHRIRRVGSMVVARRTVRRSPGAALWGSTAGILLYLYMASARCGSCADGPGRGGRWSLADVAGDVHGGRALTRLAHGPQTQKVPRASDNRVRIERV